VEIGGQKVKIEFITDSQIKVITNEMKEEKSVHVKVFLDKDEG